AEFERELIRDRVRAGLRNARAKGKRLGRPRAIVDAARVAALRRDGASWAAIGARLGVSRGTVRWAGLGFPKNASARRRATP
ncbi:MAG: helix-turn-helix domain-containing protein, partial [Acidimicrobiia bacterium]